MKRIIPVVLFLAMFPLILFAQGENEMSQPEKSNPPEDAMNIREFSTLDEARMVAGDNPTVLFFYADWCPVCRAELKEIEERSDSLEDINVIIVDYDKNPDLKQKYGVTYQHTYVQIDENGEALTVWNGGGMDEILSRISR